jgi:hypothetical protein
MAVSHTHMDIMKRALWGNRERKHPRFHAGSHFSRLCLFLRTPRRVITLPNGKRDSV